jgi:hypothetical protein
MTSHESKINGRKKISKQANLSSNIVTKQAMKNLNKTLHTVITGIYHKS